MYKLFLFLSMYLLGLSLQAQSRFVPDGLRVGVDVYNAAASFWTNTGQYELSTDLAWGRWLLATDFGLVRISEEGNLRYLNEGTYLRIGPELNLLHKQLGDEVLYVGVKYAFCNFTEQIQSENNLPLFGSVAIDTQNELRANWLELNFGIKFKVWKAVYMGYTLRYMFSERYRGEQRFEPYKIPAVGSPEESNFDFAYYIYYRIPFKKNTPSATKP